jgi:hypothetical protein
MTWQKIETAPKDGTLVLLYWPYWHRGPTIGRYTTRAIWEADNATSARSSRDAYLVRLKARGLVEFTGAGIVRAAAELFE